MAALADRVAEASLQPARQAKKQAAAARARRRQRNANPALTPIQDDPALPRVLLIGDSISIGYTLPVRAQLKGEANVHRIATNGGPTTNGLANLDQWLGNKKWDVIHFNWGLHDLKYIDDDKNLVSVDKGHQQVAIDAYEKNLRELVGRLKRSGATLVWCSTTPVPEGAQGRVAGDAKKYNAVAAKIMAEEDVAVDDLYSFAEPRLQEIQRPRNVHFTPAGSDALAEEVARNIREALKERASQ
ncbi:MAG: SGNH/GDSL hydrolase family protein [Planctomycetota bacterium]|nr:MAG: SGNH/GDSL hydrolase family protein [Planctomycetota bacterium]